MRTMVSLLVTFSMALFANPVVRADQPPKLPDRIGEVLWWLPDDTETIIVAQSPLKGEIPDDPNVKDVDQDEFLHPFPLTGLLEVPKIKEVIQGRKILLSVEGSRRFRAPEVLGLMPFEGAQIIVFKDDIGPVLKPLKDATRTEEIAGHRALLFEEQLEADLWTSYVTQPKPNVLVCATDRGYLQEVLARMAKKATTRALPEDLPEWKHLDATTPLWGIRHYDPKNAPNDTSSPLAGGKLAAYEEPDDKAIGLTFSNRPGEDSVTNIKYFSQNDQAVGIARKRWHLPDVGMTPTIRQLEPGIVDISFSHRMPEDKGESYLWFLLLCAVGHAIFL